MYYNMQLWMESGFGCKSAGILHSEILFYEIPLDITKTYDKIISDSDNQMSY